MNQEIFNKILTCLIVVLVSIVIYSIINRILKNIFKLNINRKNKRKAKTAYSLLSNFVKYLIIIISLITILNVCGVKTSGFIASLSVVGVVIGLAIQDILKDFLSGLSIILEDQYAVGDVVTISDFKGEVVSLGLRITKIKALSGEIKVVSNRNISEVINHSLEPSLATVVVGVSYDEDLEKVERVLNSLFKRLNNEIKMLEEDIKILGVESFSSSSIDYKIVVKVKPTTQYDVERILKKEIKMEFDKNNISIPYNQLVVHNA